MPEKYTNEETNEDDCVALRMFGKRVVDDPRVALWNGNASQRAPTVAGRVFYRPSRPYPKKRDILLWDRERAESIRWHREHRADRET